MTYSEEDVDARDFEYLSDDVDDVNDVDDEFGKFVVMLMVIVLKCVEVFLLVVLCVTTFARRFARRVEYDVFVGVVLELCVDDCEKDKVVCVFDVDGCVFDVVYCDLDVFD